MSCNKEKKPAEKKAQTSADTTVAKAHFSKSMLADSVCVGCGMVIKTDQQIADTVHYQGKVYGVCRAQCKTDFLKDPKGHMAKLHQPKSDMPKMKSK